MALKCLTPQENQFLENLLKSVPVNGAAPDAIQTVTLIQSILGKITGPATPKE